MLTFEFIISTATKPAWVVLGALILLCGYRILLHPLRSFPGPVLAKVTACDHQKYGPVFRLAPDRLVFDTVTAFRSIYQSEQMIKSYTYQGSSKDFKINVFNDRNHATHRTKRRLIGQVLTQRSMQSFEPAMAEQVEVYLLQIQEASQNSTPVNMTDKARHLALDVVGQLAFAYDLKIQTRPDNRFMLNAMSTSIFRLNLYQHLYFLHRWEPKLLLNYLSQDSVQKYSTLLHTMIKSRMGLEKHAKANFYSFTADTLEAEPDTLADGSMWTEAIFFIAAGGDAVSTLIAAMFFYLSRNADCYRKLALELQSTFPSGREIKGGPQLAGCSYLRACIDEALRMSPPVASIMWREQDPADERPLVIDGHVIPRGTLVSVSPYALHHNEAYFPNPFTFNPVRWLDFPGNEEARKIANDAFGAFSIGPRGCAGKAMAYLEAGLVMAKSLCYFDFEPAQGSLGLVGAGRPGAKDGRDKPGEFQTYDVFTAQHDGPYLVFRPRDGLSEKE